MKVAAGTHPFRNDAWPRFRARAARRWKDFRWSWPSFLRWSFAVLVALILGAVLWLYFLDWNTMRGPVGRYVSHRLGREVRIEGNLKVDLFSWTPSLSAQGVTIANPAWAKDKLAADVGRFAMSVRLMPLFSGRLVLPNVEIDDAHVLVVRDADGNTNWDMASSTKEGWQLPPIHRFVVKDGHLRVEDAVRKVTFVGSVNSNETAGGGDRAFSLSGDGMLNRSKFSAQVFGGPLLHVDASHPYRFTADISSGATHITAAGMFPRPFHLNQVAANTTFAGPSMSELYDLTGLVLPSTPPYRISANITRDGAVYRFANLTGTVGRSDLNGEMTVLTAQTPNFLKATLSSKQLRFVDLGPLVGQKPVGAKAQAAGLRALPDAPLDVDRLRQMNADVQYDAQSITAQDFPLKDFHTHVMLDNGVLSLDPLTFDFTRGKLAGRIRIDATRAVPATDLDARLSGIHIEQFVKGAPPPVEGVLAARARLHAVGASVHQAAANADGAVTFVVPSGRVRKSFAELTGIDVLNGLGLLLSGDTSTADLRCALVRFDAKNGNLAAERFTIDTESVLIQGRGDVNLKDETMALEVQGHPKELRIGRLRAPITISGSFDNPHIGLKAGSALAQGGIATALGFLNPIAAILAFVDPGLAKDANCAALTASAAQGPAPVKAQPVRHRKR